MNVQSSVPVRSASDGDVLAGAQDGCNWALRTRAAIDRADSGFHAVDFVGVRLATASWLREAVLGLVTYARATRPDIRLIVSNASPAVLEELQVALEHTKAVLIAAHVPASKRILRPRLIGTLDQALDESLKAVVGRTESDAPFLTRTFPQLGLSAANNRLSALEERGALISERRGRSRVYRPILEGLSYGN